MPFLGEILSFATAVFWAIGVVLFKKSGEHLPPLSLSLFKNTVGLLLLTATLPLVGQSFAPELQPSDWWLLAASGIFGIAIADTMLFYSLDKLGAGLTALVDTLYTPIMLVLSFAVLGEDIGFPALLGAALIIAGLVYGSAEPPLPGRTRRDLVLGATVAIVSLVIMAVAIVIMKPILGRAPVIWVAWFRMLVATAAMIPMIALMPSRRAIIASLKPSPIWPTAFAAAFFGTYLALTAWIAGMKYTDVHIAALLNQLSTIFIFILAVVILKEPLTRRRLVAIALAFSGALIVVSRG